MNRIEYLHAALKAGCYKQKAWVITAFSLIKEAPDEYRKKPYPYRIVQSPTGFYYLDPVSNELLRIDDAPTGVPLFSFKEVVPVTPEICPNLNEPIQSPVGNILTNLIVIVNAFGTKFPYVTGKINIGVLEDRIAEKLQDTPPIGTARDNSVFYVDEYIKFVDSLAYLTGFSQLCVWSATEKTMTAPPGLDEFKKQLLIKYAGKLTDPTELVKYEKELRDFDEAYLTDDPANGVLMSGKVKNVARKKMFLTMGAAQGFTESLDVVPITNSLKDGWPTDPVQFTAMMNELRSGSYSRGSETVKGGVSAKVLLRSSSNLKIQQEDCGTTLGIPRLFTNKDIHQLVGRSIRLSNDWKLLSTIDEANSYIGKPVMVRSPMYCKLDDDNLCRYCVGEKLAQNPTGITSALTEVSGIILTASLRKMHGSVLATAHINKDTAFS